MNKFRKTPRSEDIELGKAGLASMETLDDSTKDPWNQESVPDGAAKESEKAADEPEPEKKQSLIASIQNYNCSIGEFDWLTVEMEVMISFCFPQMISL